jgi:hypothetical protein
MATRAKHTRRVRQQPFEARLILELIRAAGEDSRARDFLAQIPGGVRVNFALFNEAFAQSPLRLYSACVKPFPILGLIGNVAMPDRHPVLAAFRRHRLDRQPGALVIHRDKMGPIVVHNYGQYYHQDGRTTVLRTSFADSGPVYLERWEDFLASLARHGLPEILGAPVTVEPTRAAKLADSTPQGKKREPYPTNLSPYEHVYFRNDEWFCSHPVLLRRVRKNRVAGLLASHLVYLFGRDFGRRTRAGIVDTDLKTRWWACTQREMAGWIAATAKQVKLAIRLLKQQGLLVTRKADGQMCHPGHPKGFRGLYVRPGPTLVTESSKSKVTVWPGRA